MAPTSDGLATGMKRNLRLLAARTIFAAVPSQIAPRITPPDAAAVSQVWASH